MKKKDLDKIVTVDKIVNTLMKDAEDSGYLEPENEMVYKVPPYNDELDTNEADDRYNIKNKTEAHMQAEAQMQEAYASVKRMKGATVKRIKGVSYRSSRLSSDNLSADSSYIKKKFEEVNRNVLDTGEKYYVIFREDFDTLTQAVYVEADSPLDAIIEARLVEWLSFKGNTESTFNMELPFDLIAVIKGWPEDVTPISQ